MKRLLTRSEVAEMLGCTPQTISNYVNDGIFKAHKAVKDGRQVLFIDSSTVLAILDDAKTLEASRANLEEAQKKLADLRRDVEHEWNDLTRMHKLFKQARGGINETISRRILSSYVVFAQSVLTPHQYDVMQEFLDGVDIHKLASDYGVTHEAIRILLLSASRKLAHVEGYGTLRDENIRLKEENEVLNKANALLNDENEKLRSNLPQDKLIETYCDDRERIRMAKLLCSRLVDYDLSVRTLNVLRSAEIYTVADLVRLNKTDMLRMRNCGRKSLTELNDLVCALNLEWGMDIRPYYIDNAFSC